jgi:hypothetical protein
MGARSWLRYKHRKYQPVDPVTKKKLDTMDFAVEIGAFAGTFTLDAWMIEATKKGTTPAIPGRRSFPVNPDTLAPTWDLAPDRPFTDPQAEAKISKTSAQRFITLTIDFKKFTITMAGGPSGPPVTAR